MYHDKYLVGFTLTKLSGTGEIAYCSSTSYAPPPKLYFSKYFKITLVQCVYISFR